ncbi:MAG: family 16 glycosylhydrolase, partial [Planktomarina sp.]
LLNTNVWDHGEGNQISIPTVDMSNGFHTYGLEWTAEEITWYIDDVPMRTVPNTVGEKMYLVASLAVDTTWTGPTDATTNFNDAFQIDYIHVYETDDPGNNPAVTGTQIFAEPIVYGEGAGPETLFGTGWGDLFKGGGADDKLYGRDGDDDLEGGKGADTLHGQTGNDHLKGQGGDDKLIGGEGLDVLDGGKGTDHMWGGSWTEEGAEDRFVFRPGDGKDFVHDFEAGVDLIDLSAYNVDWPTLQNHFESQGWATTIDLASIGGVAGDLTFLVGVDINDLTQDDFVL